MYHDTESTHTMERNGHVENANKNTLTNDTDENYYKGRIMSLNEEIKGLNKEIKVLNNEVTKVTNHI